MPQAPADLTPASASRGFADCGIARIPCERGCPRVAARRDRMRTRRTTRLADTRRTRHQASPRIDFGTPPWTQPHPEVAAKQRLDTADLACVDAADAHGVLPVRLRAMGSPKWEAQ